MKIIIGMTGATGAIYGVTLLKALREAGAETHLILSRWAEKTIALECGETVSQVRALASRYYAEDDMAAPISSGSWKNDGMVVIPCSMKTLSLVSHSLGSNLISRAADVTLKERRRLVIVPRETPLHALHLENLLTLARIGAVILPPMPAFYNQPQTVQDLVNHTVNRVLDQFGFNLELSKRWEGEGSARNLPS